MRRLDSIDIARAIAIFLMVMCHFTIYITRPEGVFPNIYFFGDHILGDFPAAMFLFLVGVSLCLSINKSRQNGILEGESNLKFSTWSLTWSQNPPFSPKMTWIQEQGFCWKT